MEQLKEPIFKSLSDLGEDEFKTFKCLLGDPDNLAGLQPIPKSDLEKADRMDTTDLIVETYADNKTQIIENILRKMKAMHLLNTPEGIIHTFYKHAGVYVSQQDRNQDMNVIHVSLMLQVINKEKLNSTRLYLVYTFSIISMISGDKL